MTNFLPNITRMMMPGRIILCVLVMAGSIGAQAQADLQISDFLLTPGDEHGFDYSYSITNAGNQSVSSYAMKCTFSATQTLSGFEYFTIQLPGDPATQFIGAGQTATRTGHFETAAVNKLLPSGTWFVFAVVNADRAVTESNYDNNSTVSNNSITVASYVAQFVTQPSVSSIMNNSFVIGYTDDDHLIRCYYRNQFAGAPAPSADDMRSSSEILPDRPLTILNLSPAQTYDVYFMGEARDGNVTPIYKVQAATTGSSSPAVSASVDQLSLYPTGVGATSLPGFVSIYGYHLAGPVVVTASEGFVASLDDVTYTQQVSIPAAGFAGGATQLLFVRSNPFDSRGSKTGSCTLTTTGSSNYVMDLDVVIFSRFITDFEGVSSIDETGWIAYSVSGGPAWALNSGDNTTVMEMDGSVNGASENEDWLISPEMDLSTFTLVPALRFRAYSSGAGLPLALKYSADYPGYGDPRNSNWFDASVTLPAVDSKSWTNVMLKLLDQGESMRFAFVYKSTSTQASRWSIDDWRITDNPVNIPDNAIVFEDVSVGKASDARSIMVSVLGYGSVTVTASDEFQVSSDGIVFSPAIVVPEADIATGISLRVRYFPKKYSDEKLGSLTFTGGSGLSVVKNVLVGRMGLTTAVEEVTAGTGFLYPNPTDGIVHVDLSWPDPEATYPILVANSIGGSVATLNAPAYALDNTLTSIFTGLQPGVYFVIIKGQSTTWRTKLIRK
jgi:hypothetical protein